jgi:hypothetical protein
METTMSFEPQENHGSCGTAALRYALSLLGCGHVGGRKMTEITLRKVIGKTRLSQQRKGTSEDELAAAAHRLSLDLAVHSYSKFDPQRCLADLQTATGKGHPCIVSFHDDDQNHFHWVCVAGFEGTDVIVLDPALLDCDLPEILFDPLDPEGEYVPARMSVRRFVEWITTADPLKAGEDSHFFIELWPSDDHQKRFVPGRWTGELLRAMEEDPDLCRHFDEYIDDLRSIFGIPGGKDEGRPAHEFLLEHERWLNRLAEQWTTEPEQVTFYAQEIRTLLALTKAYRFTVAVNDEPNTLARLCFYLGWMGCENTYEVGRYE